MDDNSVVNLNEASPHRTVGGEFIIDPDVVLKEAIGKLAEVVVIGYTEGGTIEVYSSHSPQDALWAMEEGKLHILLMNRDDA